MGQGFSCPDPKTPLGYMCKTYCAQLGPKKQKRLVELAHAWNGYTYENPALQFPDEGTFDSKKLHYLRGVLEILKLKPKPKQMEYWFLWDNETSKRKQKSIEASLRDSNEIKKKK